MRRRTVPFALLVNVVLCLFGDAGRAEACSGARSPRLGGELTRIIEARGPEDRLSHGELGAIRDRILALGEAGREQEARALEETTMSALGYRKVWLRCGPGVFVWRVSSDTPNLPRRP